MLLRCCSHLACYALYSYLLIIVIKSLVGLRRLSPPRGAGWEPGSIAFRAKKSPRPSDDYEYSCVRGAIGAVTVRLFKPSTWPQQRKVLAPGIILLPGYTLAGRWG